jgi:hypothetical protein
MSKFNSSRSDRSMNRRIVLQGAGVGVALPWMESMPVWGGEPDEQHLDIPKRFCAMFMSCGVHPKEWWAKPRERGIEFSECLRPLVPVENDINVVEGLFNANATNVGIHPGQTGNILSGAALQKGASLRGGISIDQYLANRLGKDTEIASFVLGCEQPTTGFHESNFSMAYSSHISWQDANSPVPVEVYPAQAFDRLFNNQGSQRHKSILDRIREHALHLSRSASAADQRKLDEYLSSVREVEQQIEQMRSAQEKALQRLRDKGSDLRMMSRPDDGLPEDIRDHMRLMCDIVAMAFQTDKTRFGSLLLCRDLSGLFYPFLNVRKAHHLASHQDESDEWARVTTYYCSQFAYLVQKLKSMSEGAGTVLDNSVILFINNMFSGSKHDSTRLPLLMGGKLGGTIKTGRVLDFMQKEKGDRRLCGLYLSLIHRFGLEAKEFGDADRPLDV